MRAYSRARDLVQNWPEGTALPDDPMIELVLATQNRWALADLDQIREERRLAAAETGD